MISIAICDDNAYVAKLLSERVDKYLKCKEIDYFVEGYTSCVLLLSHIDKFDCFFLDIDMPEMNGYDVAKIIREKKKDCCIIMATARVLDYKPAFALNVFRFITKPFNENEIEEALEKYLAGQKRERTMEVYYKRTSYAVPHDKIMYIRAINSEVEVVTKDKIFRKECSLTDIQKELDGEAFFRCHRTYVINLDKARMENRNVFVESFCVPVAKRKYKEVENAIINYSMKYK